MSDIYTMNFTEYAEPGGIVYPTTRQVGAYNTAWLSMRDHQRAVFIVQVGDIGAGGTVDFMLQEATDVNGTGAQAVAGKYITQLTQAGGDGDDLVIVEIRTEEMDVNDGYDYLRGVLTVGTNTAVVGIIPLRIASNYPPVPVTGWTEIVL